MANKVFAQKVGLAIKRATVGAIGDGQKTMTVGKFQRRVADQLNRYGEYNIAFPLLVELARKLGYRFTGNWRTGVTVHLPVRRRI